MSTSLRDRLNAKSRRRVLLPVQVSDPGREKREAFDSATKRLALVQLLDSGSDDEDDTSGVSTSVTEAQAERDAAQAALDEHYELVEFQSLPPAEMEAFSAGHTKPDGDLDDVGGVPVLAAASAVDEDLRDVDWWTEQLADIWTAGERASLWTTLLELNYSAPGARAPKG